MSGGSWEYLCYKVQDAAFKLCQSNNAQRKAFGIEMVTSKIIGDEVHHAHVWLIPDRKAKGDPKDFEGNAEKIRTALE